MYTNFVHRKLTSEAEKPDVEPTQEVARSQNPAWRELFRGLLKWIAGRIRARKYRALMKKLSYVDAGRKFTREEMNER